MITTAMIAMDQRFYDGHVFVEFLLPLFKIFLPAVEAHLVVADVEDHIEIEHLLCGLLHFI